MVYKPHPVTRRVSNTVKVSFKIGPHSDLDFCYFQFNFDDVLAEPSASQGFDGMWRLSFILFTHTKLWFYRLFAAILAIPAALVWGFVFSVLSVLYIWILAPVLRLFDLGVAIVRRVIGSNILTFLSVVWASSFE